MARAHAPALSLARLLDPDVLADPYPLYRRFRDESPVLWDPYLHVWVVTSYRECVQVLQRFSAQRAPRVDDLVDLGLDRLTPIAHLMAEQMLFLDPPQHNRVRALAAAAFTPRRVERLRARIEQVTRTLLDDVPSGAEVDLMESFAHPLPAIVMAETLGTPVDDWPRLKAWSEALSDMLGAIQHNPAAAAGLLTHLSDLIAYFRDAVHRQANAEDGSLVAAMANAEVGGERLSEDEVVANLILTMVGGYETTSHLIGSGLLTLLRNPDQLERWRADRALTPLAIEELLRLESPIQHTARIAPADTELCDRRITRGQPVLALLGAANRDPEQFVEPDRVDVGREDNRHLGFGWAGHFCFGAALARMEGSLALNALLDRTGTRLGAAPVTWRQNPAFRGPATLPVVLG